MKFMNITVLVHLFLLLSCTNSTHELSIKSIGNWTTLETKGKAEARHENSFVECDGKFYLLGGREIKAVNIFDPISQTWTNGAAPPIEIHHFQAVSYKSQIYVAAAMSGGWPSEKPLEYILIYDPASDQWSEGPKIPKNRQRGSAGIVIADNVLYLISGIIDGHNGNHVKWLDSYNFATKEWLILEDTPLARDHFHAVHHEGKIYNIGGRNSSHGTGQDIDLTVATIDIYDINKASWTSLPAEQNLPTERAGAATILYNNHILVLGGESIRQKMAHHEVEAFNLDSQRWTTLQSMNEGRHGIQALVFSDRVFVAAGCGAAGGEPELASIEAFIW